jgi:TnpA family transposase
MEKKARARTIIAMRQLAEALVWANERMIQVILEAAKWAAMVVRESSKPT